MQWFKKTSAQKAGQKQAFAVGYSTEELAPRILASGGGGLARRILELAGEYDIPVHQDADLVEFLSVLEPGMFIPEELYEAFAVILAGLYRANNQAQ